MPKSLFPVGYHTKAIFAVLFCSVRATCAARPFLHDIILSTVFDEDYKE